MAESIEFDPKKDRLNIAKHGISLSRAHAFDWNRALVLVDARFDYGEVRYRAFGPIGERLHCLVYTVRRGNLRAISLRRASRRETDRWRGSLSHI